MNKTHQPSESQKILKFIMPALRDCHRQPWGFFEQPTPILVETCTCDQGYRFLQVQVVGLVTYMMQHHECHTSDTTLAYHTPPPYQNLECRSYEVTLKTGCWRCGRSGVMGLVGAYYIGARPQLIGCALAQEPGVLNFRLRVANNGGRQICGDKKVIGLCFSRLQTEV